MTPKLHLPILLSLLGASVVPSIATDRFPQFDKNGDGMLTREELPAAKIFDGADADKDGLLTREELGAYFRNQQGGTPPSKPTVSPSPSPPPAPMPAAKVEIVESLNLPYSSVPGVDPNLLSLDIHAPKGAKGLPVVIYVHGGYWKAGDKSQKGHLPEFFCQRGFVFVTVNYRLAPAVKHPVLIQDVARAVAWVHDHIAEHGGDAAQIFLTGHSAGAQLVALLGTDAKRLGELGKPLSILRGVIPLDSAAMDIRGVAADDRRADSPYRAAFGDDPAAWADASPLVYAESAKSVPHFQIVVAYGPAIANKKVGVDAFAAALRKNGTRAEVVDASSFREHQSLMTEFGAEGDPVSAAVIEFIASVRQGTEAGQGSERVLKPEGQAAAAAAQQLEAYRTRVLMMQFDKNKDGRITKDEMPTQAFLFDRMDADKDGVVTAQELGAYEQQRQPPTGQPTSPPRPSADAWEPADAPHPQLKSCEPDNGGRGAFGRSRFTAQGGDDKDADSSIWLLGFAPRPSFAASMTEPPPKPPPAASTPKHSSVSGSSLSTTPASTAKCPS